MSDGQTGRQIEDRQTDGQIELLYQYWAMHRFAIKCS